MSPALLAATTVLSTCAIGAIAQSITGNPVLGIAAAAVAAAANVLVFSGNEVPIDRDQALSTQETQQAGSSEDDSMPALVQDAMERLPVGVAIVSSARVITYTNNAIEDLFGLNDLIGQSFLVLRARRLLDQIDACLANGNSTELEFTLSRVGDSFLKAYVARLKSGDALITLEDRTREKVAEHLHRDFVANASHELKTPLAAVHGVIDTLLGHARDDPEATERFLELLSKQTSRMTGLINDLMSLNRIEMNQRVLPENTVDLIILVRKVIDALEATAQEAGVIIEADLDSAPVEIRGDEDELAQLFRNLIENAIKYGGAGGIVTIRRAEPAPEGPGLIGISVQDRGPGIEREHLPRLTERFYRINVGRSRDKGGTGLGLAIVKHILNRHRGRLEVDSMIGEGSTFTAWLPVSKIGNQVRLTSEAAAGSG